jgi:4-amino-4-deoxy-L-arabinose transferase-like glycosyltransferase
MPKFSVAILAVALVFITLFWRLGRPTFWDPDEAHYAQTSREMLSTGDWWAPYYNEEPFFDKPVLFHQLQALAMGGIADAEFAARIVPALAALGLVAITVWFGTIVLSTQVGVVGGLMLAATPGIVGLARYAILDTLFTMFLFGGAACLTVAALHERPKLQWIGYVSLALAVFTKGPLALALCGLTFLVAIAASAELRRRLLALHWMTGLVFVLALAAPPFVYLYLRFGDDFVNGYVLDENLRLFAASRFANQPGYRFYFQILALGLLPWTGLVIGRFIDDVRTVVRGERLEPIEILLWAWPLTIVAFFTLSTFKLDHYVFPASPALCLLGARAWFDVRANRSDARLAATRVGFHLIGPLLLLIGLASGYVLFSRLALPWGAAALPIAFIVAGALMTVEDLRARTPPAIPWAATVAMAVTYATLIAFVLPVFEAHKVIPDLAQWVAVRAQPGDRVASYRLNRWTPAYRFYVGRHTTFLEDPSQAAAYFGDPSPFYAVMRRDGYDELAARGIPIRIMYEREGMVATSGRALWRTGPPLTRFVVVTNVPQ